MVENEAATAAVLREHGNETLAFGTAQLSARARELQRRDMAEGVWPPDLSRWLQDNIVRTVSGETVYADAKFALKGKDNHSIEMRSMLAGHLQTRPVWYVCSRRAVGAFVDFKAIRLEDVPTDWACCSQHQAMYITRHSVHDANAKLPRFCMIKRDTVKGGSATPYFVIRKESFKPGDPFGLMPGAIPCRECGGLVQPLPPHTCDSDCHHEADLHPACRSWPNTSTTYGNEVA